MPKVIDQEQRTAAITGAGSGLGRDIALGLAAKGYCVVGTAMLPEEIAVPISASIAARIKHFRAIGWLSSVNSRQGIMRLRTMMRKKCAHIPCRCEIPHEQEYCGQACRDASREEVEIACQCDHPPECPLITQ